MIKQRFFAGLVILLPLTITYMILKFIVNLVTKPFHHFVHDVLLEYGIASDHIWFVSHEQVIVIVSKVLILLFLLVFLFFIGFISRLFAHKIFVSITDSIMKNIPFVGRIYSACKDFTNALFSPKSETFSQVALVPYPSREHRSIGFISAELRNDFLPLETKEIVSVLIPGTPNPTVGFVLLFPKEDITLIDMSPQDAIRFIMSCGTSLPSSSSVSSIDLRQSPSHK